MSDGVGEAAVRGLNHTIDNDGVADDLPDLIPVPGTVSYAGASGGAGEIRVGDHIVWSVTVQNTGTAATPPGTPEPSKTGHLDVLFAVSPSWNGLDNWEDRDASPLAAGATRIETADGGSDGVNYWIAGPAGDYTLNVWVNSANPRRITESDYANNTMTFPFTVYVAEEVIDPPNILNDGLVPDGRVNRPYNFQFDSSGTDPEVWTRNSGTLMTGVVLEQNGQLLRDNL